MKVWQDEEIEAREVPFANIFLSAKPEYQVERKCYEGLRSVELAQEELKNYRGDAGMIARLREEHGNELKLAPLAKYTQSVLSYIRKQEARLDKSDAPDKRQRRRELAERRRAVMSRFNKRYQEAVLNA